MWDTRTLLGICLLSSLPQTFYCLFVYVVYVHAVYSIFVAICVCVCMCVCPSVLARSLCVPPILLWQNRCRWIWNRSAEPLGCACSFPKHHVRAKWLQIFTFSIFFSASSTNVKPVSQRANTFMFYTHTHTDQVMWDARAVLLPFKSFLEGRQWCSEWLRH